MIFTILLFIAGALYGASFLSAGFGEVGAARRRMAFFTALAGFAFHTAALGLRCWQTSRVPVGTSYEFVESTAWIFAALQLAVSLFMRTPLAGFFSMLPAAVLTLLPACCPAFPAAMESAPKSVFSYAAAHGILAAFSYGFTAASALLGGLYLRQCSILRGKTALPKVSAMPSLYTLGRGVGAFASTAAASMLASIALGAYMVSSGDTNCAMLVKFAAGAAVFAGQAAFCALAVFGVLRGVRLAKFSIALFAAALILLVPIELRTVL